MVMWSKNDAGVGTLGSDFDHIVTTSIFRCGHVVTFLGLPSPPMYGTGSLEKIFSNMGLAAQARERLTRHFDS